MGPEALVAAMATVLGLFTWSHQQRQSVINSRFDSIKKRVEVVEDKIEELPVKYVLKSDLNTELGDIRIWLRSINDKLDRLIMSRNDENKKYNIWIALTYEIVFAICEHYRSLNNYKIVRIILSYCKHDWILWKIESTLISVDEDIEKIQKAWDKEEKPKTIYSELPPDGSNAQGLLGGEMRITGNYDKT